DKIKNEKINIGVISNHNKFYLDEFKQLQKQAKKNEIYLLPGIELSVNDGANGIHAIIVFDYNEWCTVNDNFIDHFLKTVFAGKANFENSNGRCNFNLLDVIKKLSSFNKNYFVILAHVEQNNGFLSELDGGRIGELGASYGFSNILGMQKIRSEDKIKNLKIWLNNKLPAFVEGSDPKNIEEIGKGNRQTFVKIGDFNFEALMFALKNKASRIKNCFPQTKNVYIKSIKFIGGKLDGETISFSSNANNFIGIRGSGKSLIIEMLRYALTIGFGEKAMDKKYKNKLIEFALTSGGKVELEVVNNERIYKIERILNQKPSIFLNDKVVPEITLSAIINKPIYFGQKDLSNTGEGFEKDLLEKIIGNELKPIRDRAISQYRKIKNIIRELQNLKDMSSKKEEVMAQQADYKHRLEEFAKYNLDKKLKRQVSFNKDDVKLKEFCDLADEYAFDLNQFVNKYSESFDNLGQYQASENKDIFEIFFKTFDEIKLGFSAVKMKVPLTEEKIVLLKKYKENFKKRYDTLKEEFAKIQREMNLPKINANVFLEVNKSIDLIKLKIIEIEKSIKKKGEIEKSLANELSELNDLWHKEFRAIQFEIQRINSSQKFIQINIMYKSDKSAFFNFMSDILKGSGLYRQDIKNLIDEFQDGIEIFK
ncbi:MAG: hypothetical protein U9Q34_06385, partial [Elusimicrobiota bacterium]|nr:hypothetical protein [Elusimicrobiota bacterium]